MQLLLLLTMLYCSNPHAVIFSKDGIYFMVSLLIKYEILFVKKSNRLAGVTTDRQINSYAIAS